MLLLHGSAGVGKSTVVYALAERIHLERPHTDQRGTSRIGATYFCTPTNGCNDRYRLFPTIAFQLAHYVRDIRAAVIKATIDIWSHPHPEQLRDQCEQLVLTPLRHLEQLERHDPILILIDGADQFENQSNDQPNDQPNNQDILLHLLSGIAQELQFVRILVSGRNLAPATGSLNAIEVDLDDISMWNVTSDLTRYLKDELSAFAKRSESDVLQKRIDVDMKRLIKLANSSFLVASAMLQYVLRSSEESVKRIDDLLNSAATPDGISAGFNVDYHPIIHQAFPSPANLVSDHSVGSNATRDQHINAPQSLRRDGGVGEADIIASTSCEEISASQPLSKARGGSGMSAGALAVIPPSISGNSAGRTGWSVFEGVTEAVENRCDEISPPGLMTSLSRLVATMDEMDVSTRTSFRTGSLIHCQLGSRRYAKRTFGDSEKGRGTQ